MKLPPDLITSGFFVQRGAVLVETAISFLIYFVLVIGAIDLCRYFVLTGVLHYAAYVAVDTFSKETLNVATDAPSCTGVSLEDCQAYGAAVKQAIRAGSKAAELLAAPAKNPGEQGLTQWLHYTEADYAGYNISPAVSGAFTGQSSSVALLRPGERVRRSDGTYFDHPTRHWGIGENQGWPKTLSLETWEQLFSSEPIIAHIECDFRPLLPFLPSFTLSATQLAFHRSSSSFSKTAAIASPPFALNTPTYEVSDDPPAPVPWPTSEPTCGVAGACPALTREACCLSTCYLCPNHNGICSADDCEIGN